MIDSFYIAWRYVVYHRARTATLVACVTLIGVLPLALQLFLAHSQEQLLARATTTPLVVGAKGSALDLVMNSLYFGDQVPDAISMASNRHIMDSGLAAPIPLYVRFRSRKFPIVGTTFDYFEARGLRVAEGRFPATLGECVLGAAVAERLGLQSGDSLVSSPESVFDLAGVYPLKMKVVGLLAPAHTPDDFAIFVDVKTAWIIEGLGHGHQDLTRTRDPSVILERNESNVTANAKLVQFTEITEDNLDSFHFHGDPSIYPITAVIAVPHDEKSGTLLRGRYLNDKTDEQIVRPSDVIDGLLENIFRIKNVLDAVVGVVGLATALALVLVFALSIRLRQREIETIFRIGCSRLTIVRLLVAEVVIIVIVSGLLCATLLLVVEHYSDELIRLLLIR